jgi:hypothetical protein
MAGKLNAQVRPRSPATDASSTVSVVITRSEATRDLLSSIVRSRALRLHVHGWRWDNEHNVTVSARATICFNSNRPGITRGHDIVCARRVQGAWENPQPLFAAVNGPSADVEGFIDPEERFLVFASTRAGGKGSFDLYISVNRDGRRLLFARSEGGRNVLYECQFDPRWLDIRP